MLKTERVTLKLEPGASKHKGWTTVTAPNTNMEYSFRYTGGHDDIGGLKTKVGDGPATINLDLHTEARYSVSDVTFKNDLTPPQLSRTFTPSTAAITDLNTADLDADYCVLVYDSTNGSVIPCDPMIHNDPKNPLPMGHRIQHSQS